MNPKRKKIKKKHTNKTTQYNSQFLSDKQSRIFPGLSRTPMTNFSGHFRSSKMFKKKSMYLSKRSQQKNI